MAICDHKIFNPSKIEGEQPGKVFSIYIYILLQSFIVEIWMSYEGFYHVCQAGAVAENIHAALSVPEIQIFSFGDDLSYGPLKDIDTGAQQRSAFLSELYDNLPTHEIQEKLRCEAHQLQPGTQRTDKPIVIWHGANPAEQLLLRRAVYALRTQLRPLFEVFLSPDLVSPERGLTAYGMLDPKLYGEAWKNVEIIGTDRAQRLIADWQRVRNDDGIRHYRCNWLSTHPIGRHDADILELVDENWVNCSIIVAAAMGTIKEIFASDIFVKGRIRKLVQDKRVEMRRDSQSGECQIRRTVEL